MKKFLYLFIAGLFSSCIFVMEPPEGSTDYSGNSGTFIDQRDSTEYQWVRIGDQIWMAENVKYLPAIQPHSETSFTDSLHYLLNFDSYDLKSAKETEYYHTYGVLYNWPVATHACPAEWHLPTFNEWEELCQFVSDSLGPYGKSSVDRGSWQGKSGTHLKATSGWKDYLGLDGNGTDDFGFHGLGGGHTQGWTYAVAEEAKWWSSTLIDDQHTAAHGIGNNPGGIGIFHTELNQGYSVRCVKNE